MAIVHQDMSILDFFISGGDHSIVLIIYQNKISISIIIFHRHQISSYINLYYYNIIIIYNAKTHKGIKRIIASRYKK